MEPIASPDAIAAPIPEKRALLDHPRGLWVLAGTELWDRISWHGMVAMLVLYMTGELLLPGRVEHVIGFAGYRAGLEHVLGPMNVTQLATQTFALYFAAITFLPLVGGWIGDRVMPRRAAVSLGALTMTAGHFAMAFDATFLMALVLLVIGAGLLRGNLMPQIRALYAAGDRRLGDAFQVYTFAINVGAFIAPIASGTMAKYYGWHAGFAVAGVGMLAGLVWYLAGSRHLPAQVPPLQAGPARQLTAAEKRNIWLLALVWPFSVAFWTAQAQVWNVYSLWVRDHIDMVVGGFAVPIPWLQSLDGLAPAFEAPLLILLWRWQALRQAESDSLGKLATGCLIFAGSTLLLALVPTNTRGTIWLPVAFHLLSNLGAMFFAPVMHATFAARAPERWRGTLIGMDMMSVAVASLISGPMGGWYTRVSPPLFWLVTAAIPAVAGVLLLALRRPLRAFGGPDPLVQTTAAPAH
ncbi:MULTISPECIES: MFS transporter [unclassified Sphingomonas]|uniref:peptide MFS transporter n=1 Tax=Novosphingobium rhizosphaerae TaxID=1551649 RepID=UPI0015CCE59F